MVAEVVSSLMGYRSDRRFANLLCTKALEAAQLIRPRRADFHQGQEHLRKLRFKARLFEAGHVAVLEQNPGPFRECQEPNRDPFMGYGF